MPISMDKFLSNYSIVNSASPFVNCSDGRISHIIGEKGSYLSCADCPLYEIVGRGTYPTKCVSFYKEQEKRFLVKKKLDLI